MTEQYKNPACMTKEEKLGQADRLKNRLWDVALKLDELGYNPADFFKFFLQTLKDFQDQTEKLKSKKHKMDKYMTGVILHGKPNKSQRMKFGD